MERSDTDQAPPKQDLLQLAGSLWSRGLCLHCLGRMVARLGYGLTNFQRGKALMVNLAMMQEAEGAPVDRSVGLDLPYLHGHEQNPMELEKRLREQSCTLCQGLFSRIGAFAELACAALRPYEGSTFGIGSKVEQVFIAGQDALVSELGLEHAEPFKQHLNRELSRQVQQQSGLEADIENPDLSLLFDARYDTVKVSSASLFIEGRYRKLVRDLPQTHWPCRDCRGLGCHVCGGTGYRYPSSVEQLIGGPLKEAAQARDERFHGAGREDIDVRCLGNGRPFVVELRLPLIRSLDLEELTQMINEEAEGKVEVTALRWTRRHRVAQIKNDHYEKNYRVEVEFERSVDEESLKKALGLLASQVIHQQTPSRVAHRRADRIRRRHLRSFEILERSESGCCLELTCEHGTYVKELVHGDDGRTNPHLAALLGTSCRVTALDVTAVHDIEKAPQDNHGQKI